MVTALGESKFPIKRNCPWVALPYTEPHDVRAALSQHFHTLGCQSLRNATPVPIAVDVQPLDLTRRITWNATRCFAPAHLREPHEFFALFGKHCRYIRIRYFLRLDFLAVAAPTVRVHVLSRIRGTERIPERAFGNCC